MYRLSDLASQGAAPAWVVLAVFVFDWVTRYEFVRTRIGDTADVGLLVALGAVLWLIYIVTSGRNYRQKTANVLTTKWDSGLNQILHQNVDSDSDFQKWLVNFGRWEGDVLAVMEQRHCSLHQRNDVANLHKFDLQPSLFHNDQTRNWWKSMMSAKLDRVARIAEELVGRRR